MSNQPQQKPFVTVIIPVFNDSERLKICLQALEAQTYPSELYEVLVIDNGSQEDIKSVVTQFKNTLIADEKQPGSYAARNKGISLAKGEILAFTDADCIPHEEWIEQGVESFLKSPNCGLVAGKIELFFKDPSCPNTVELYESIELNFLQDDFVEKYHFGVTANLFTSRSVVEAVGPFNAGLKSGGDREWGNRVFQAGYNQVYAGNARIRHPARHSWFQLYKRVTRVNGGLHDLKQLKNSTSATVKVLFKDLFLALTPPFRSIFKVWADQRLSNPKQKVQFMIAMLFVRYISAWERVRLNLGGTSRRW